MKFLKIFLPLVYAVLILLLLLLNKDCSREPEPRTPPYDRPEEPPVDPGETPQPEETTEEDLGEIADLGSGKMRFALRYDFAGDIDLHVITPGGVDIYYANTLDRPSTGELDHDEQNGGRGSKENIYFTRPPEGVYKAYLVHYAKKTNPRSERYECRLIVTKEGEEPKTYTFYLPHQEDRSTPVEVAYP